MDHKDHKDLQDHKDPQVPVGVAEPLVLEQQVQQDHKDHKARLDSLVHRDLPELLVVQDR